MEGFEFSTTADPDAEDLCRDIVAAMMDLFSVSRIEAVGRINGAWAGVHFELEDLRFHETAEYWAKTIYYGKGSCWWTNPSGLAPLPYDGAK